MLTLRMYAIRDIKSDVYLTPFTAATNGAAIRAFSDIVASPDSVIHKHSEDYSLFFVGEFDQQLGVLVPSGAPTFLEEAYHLLPANG